MIILNFPIAGFYFFMNKEGVIICTSRFTFENNSTMNVEGACFTDLSSDYIIIYVFIACFEAIFEGSNLKLRRLFRSIRDVGVVRDKITIRREQVNNSGAFGPFAKCRGIVFPYSVLSIDREEECLFWLDFYKF